MILEFRAHDFRIPRDRFGLYLCLNHGIMTFKFRPFLSGLLSVWVNRTETDPNQTYRNTSYPRSVRIIEVQMLLFKFFIIF